MPLFGCSLPTVFGWHSEIVKRNITTAETLSSEISGLDQVEESKNKRRFLEINET